MYAQTQQSSAVKLKSLVSFPLRTLAVVSPAAPSLLHGSLQLLVPHVETEFRCYHAALRPLPLAGGSALSLRSFGRHIRNCLEKLLKDQMVFDRLSRETKCCYVAEK